MAPIRRRQWLALLASVAAPMPTAWAIAGHHSTLLAAWQDGTHQHIGLLSVGEAQWSVQRSLAVPTRAHGLLAEAGGSVLAVARRPGDWLLRWHPATGQTQWHWIDGDRRFNGHVIAHASGATLWTTETDLDTGQGRIGVRDARTLEKTDEWATHGMDPHQLLALPQAVGELPAGTLMVANGGIPTLPETGRAKRALGRMDASLVALHPATGERLGQWRLADPFLSIRHLTWDPASATLGVALQAEHPDPATQAAATVLAVWDARGLRTAEGQPPMAGYGGDLCARPGGGFVVSCPRAHALALFDAQARFLQVQAQPTAYALVARAAGDGWWCGGSAGLLVNQGNASRLVQPRHAAAARWQFDNHWQRGTPG